MEVSTRNRVLRGALRKRRAADSPISRRLGDRGPVRVGRWIVLLGCRRVRRRLPILQEAIPS
jgi:hypothetical protein